MPVPLPFPEFNRPLNILIVDDQEFDRKMIASRLQEAAPENTSIAEVATGKEALDLISSSSSKFDCVLLDMNLPDIHGVDLTPIILSTYPEISIIMITVESDMDKALTCIKAGAEDFLIKGEYTNAGLYRSIRYAIERRLASRENFRLQEELNKERHLSAAQKEFIHLVSHEFRTPIAIISGAVQLLAVKAPELFTGVGASQFKKISDAIARLTGLLDNVVRLSKVEAGKEAFSPVDFDMHGLILHVLENFDSNRIENKLGGQPIPFFGDPHLVEYALHNVVSNGLKYSPPESKVSVSLEVHTRGFEIVVVDRGPGMSANMLARAGEKFYRDSKTSHIEGTGLGIHIAQRFMAHHHGTMKFESAEGKGTTVRLFFPYEEQLAG